MVLGRQAHAPGFASVEMIDAILALPKGQFFHLRPEFRHLVAGRSMANGSRKWQSLFP